MVETKDSLFTDDLRSSEAAKIDCGQAHFRALSDGNGGVRYVKARIVDNLFEGAN